MGGALMEPMADHDESGDPVSRVVALAVDWSENGRLDSEIFRGLVDEVGVPARMYADLRTAVESAGIVLFEGLPEGLDEDESDSGGWDQDGFGEFMRNTAHEILTAEQEVSIARRIERGQLASAALAERADLPEADRGLLNRRVVDGAHAADELVLHNVRLVVSLASKLRRRFAPAMDFEDLVQEGFFGLSRAVERFDWRKGFKFSTYATWWIRQSLYRALDDRALAIRLPVHAAEEIRRGWSTASRFERDGGRAPTDAELSNILNMSKDRLRRLRSAATVTASLDRGLLDNSDAPRLIDTLVVDGDPTYSEAEASLLACQIEAVLTDLNDRERRVIGLRFGIPDGPTWTLEQIGQEFGVTRERIRQIESTALAKLRHPIRSRNLREYYL